MRNCLWWIGLGLCCCLSASIVDASDRAQLWKPEASPGSTRLSLEAVDYVILPEKSSTNLQAAVGDLIELWPGDICCADSRRAPDYAPTSGRPKNSIILERSEAYWLVENFGSFSIRRERTRIHLRAASDQGLVNGIYALCQDVLGARWYWAMDIGCERVGEIPDKFPECRWRERPDFVQRQLHPEDANFGRRNRLNRVYQFNHALAKVFTPELYDQEPELFALVKGKRRRPRGHGGTDPQPDFTNPRVVELAAEAAIAHFQKRPKSRSFSLSINDNVLFDTSEWTELTVEPVQYFRSRPNYTDLVFGFMNQVAEQVFADESIVQTSGGQPRYLTGLAYYWTEPSPRIELHPRIMPVLTSDRAQWHDLDYRVEDQALAERWMDSGIERMATWDYYFGAPYPYPRQFTQWIDESLKHLNETGVDVFFSQLPSVWGMDGPKAWLAAELLWDSQQDAEVLLEEFYTNFFGTAAKPMRAFYEMAEVHRNEHEGEAEWIKFYKDEAGIELFTPELVEEMRGCVEEAAMMVSENSRYGARVQVVSDAFRFTELYAEMHQARVDLVKAILDGGPSHELLEGFIDARVTYAEYARELVKNPMHSRLSTFTRMMQSDPVPIAMYLIEGQSIDGYEELDAALASRNVEQAESLIPNVSLKHDGFTRYSFLGPYVPLIDGWMFDFRPSEKFQLLGLEPDRGIRIEGADMCSMFANVAVEAGEAYFLELECAYSISPDNRTQVQLTWKDESGQQLQVELPLRFPNGQSDSVTSVTIPMVAPEGAARLRIHFTQSRQYDGDFLELHSIDLKH